MTTAMLLHSRAQREIAQVEHAEAERLLSEARYQLEQTQHSHRSVIEDLRRRAERAEAEERDLNEDKRLLSVDLQALQIAYSRAIASTQNRFFGHIATRGDVRDVKNSLWSWDTYCKRVSLLTRKAETIIMRWERLSVRSAFSVWIVMTQEVKIKREEDKILVLEGGLEDGNLRVARLERELAVLRDQCERGGGEIERLCKREEQLNERGRDQLERLGNSEKECERLSQVEKTLKDKVKTSEDRIDVLLEEGDGREAEIERLVRAQAECHVEIDTMQVKVDEKSVEISRLKAAVAKLELDVKGLVEEGKGKDDKIKALRDEAAKLQDIISELRKKGDDRDG